MIQALIQLKCLGLGCGTCQEELYILELLYQPYLEVPQQRASF